MTVPTSTDELRLLDTLQRRSRVRPGDRFIPDSPGETGALPVLHPTPVLATRWLEIMDDCRGEATLQSVDGREAHPRVDELRPDDVNRANRCRLRRLKRALQQHVGPGFTLWLGSGLAMPPTAHGEPPEPRIVAGRERIAWALEGSDHDTPDLTPTDLLTCLVWVRPTEEVRRWFDELARRDPGAALDLFDRDRLTPDRGRAPNRRLTDLLRPDDLVSVLSHAEPGVRRRALGTMERLG